MLKFNIFSMERMRRRTYALIALPIGFITFYSLAISQFLTRSGDSTAAIPLFTCGIICLVILSFITVRRLHNANYSGWWVLLFTLILGLYIIVPIVLSLIPGTKGADKYGADPRL